MDGVSINYLSIFIGIVLGIVGLLAGAKLFSRPVSVDTSFIGTISNWIREYFVTLVLYMPTSLLFSGIFSDVLNQEFRHTISGIIGISAIALSKLLSVVFVERGADRIVGTFCPEEDLACYVPGFKYFESKVAPQAIVLPVAIFSYYLMDASRNKASSSNYAIWTLLPVMWAIEVFALSSNKCFKSGVDGVEGHYYKYGTSGGWAYFAAIVGVATVFGIVCGLIGYGVVYGFAPEKLPNKDPTAADMQSPSGASKNSVSSSSSNGGNVGTCSAPNDEDQLVCEAYKNGELITLAE